MDVTRDDTESSSPGIYRMKSSERPPGAVVISDEEVLKAQWNLLQKWEPKYQMWPFNLGQWLIGGSAGLTGILSLNHIRKVLNLKEAARFTVLAATVPVPALLTVLLNSVMVTEPILLQSSQCPVCLELRAATIQLAIGFAQPVGLAVFSSIMAAHAKKSYRFPPWNQPLAVMREVQKLLQPMRGLLSVLVTVNLFTAFNVTRYQMEKVPLIVEKLRNSDLLKTRLKK